MITLNIEPGVVKSWKQFIRENLAYSIALDGYVKGRPRFSAKGPHLNLNHHEDVDRLGTRSTIAQSHIAIKQGLFDTFQKNGEPNAILDIDDCDHDVCGSVWLFQNNERILGQKSEPLITRFVGVVDLMDATAGAYPLSPQLSIRREIGWIFEPYTEARIAGRIPEMQESEMRNVIVSVCQRITEYSLGRGKKISLDTRYEVLRQGSGFQVIRELGFEARSELFARGVKAFISVRENKDGTIQASYGKMSPYINFPLKNICHRYNLEEGLSEKSGPSHGGSDIICGSPRKVGTKLTIDQLLDYANDEIAKANFN